MLTSLQLQGRMLCIQKHKPLVGALTKTKPKNSTKEYLIIDYELGNYLLHPVNLDSADAGRGITLHIQKSVEISKTDITTRVKFKECCCIEIRLRGGDLKLFSCCYRSPTQSSTSDENNANVIAKKRQSKRCIVGDFNFI